MSLENTNKNIQRAKWNKLRLDRSFNSFLVSFATSQLIIILLFVLLYIVGSAFLKSFTDKYFFVFLLSCGFCDLIYWVFKYFRFINIEYALKSSKYVVTGNIIDIKPSKIFIKRGFIIRRLKIMPVSSFYYVTVNQTFFGRALNYGNMVLRDKNQVPKLTLYDVSNAMEKVTIIQDMIDNMQVKRPINPLMNSMVKTNNTNFESKEV